ncbi:hypothetical protein VIGAN_09163500 [Vigna angularis var. angularis]|uniref:Uncharacterized protein n=1 Tax=Vigna angularis var. angularis TaxID=157739 RepID=A0A0S3SYQ5_PHAAN|nr:hypothetical protein VIGAN_09163500 [Vigna angularis var. angularis]
MPFITSSSSLQLHFLLFFSNDHNKRTTAAPIASFISYMYAVLMIAGVIYDCMLSVHLVYFHLYEVVVLLGTHTYVVFHCIWQKIEN